MAPPWNIDSRPMPSSADPSVLCPAVVGAFSRTKIEGAIAIDQNSVYVHYANGASTIFMEVAVNSSPVNAHATLETAAGETGGAIQGTEPRWFGTDDGFFAWTRGGWFFSAHAKGGAADLDAFLRAFPH